VVECLTTEPKIVGLNLANTWH